MSKHTHHNCECAHESVKHCKTCKVIHCLDCNQEWSPKSHWTYTYGGYYGYPSTQFLGNTSTCLQASLGGGKSLSSGSGGAGTLNTSTTPVCEHKA